RQRRGGRLAQGMDEVAAEHGRDEELEGEHGGEQTVTARHRHVLSLGSLGPRQRVLVHVRIVHVQRKDARRCGSRALEGRCAMQAGTTPVLRRTPVQERSAARVERMLDAAASLLDEVGYDGTTTSLIASRAGVSVGSLYQFFPDRRAVLQALAVRSFERFGAVLSERLEASPPQRWQE